MNSFSITMIFVLLVLVILLIAVVIMLLNKKTPSVEQTVKKEKVIENVPMPNILGLFLPPKIEKLSKTELLNIVRKVYEAYKIFDYKSMDINELDKKEWHTWQISFLLMLYKKNEEFFIPNHEDIFHPFLLNSSENDMKSFMRSVVKKYDNYVNIEDTKDNLCKEHIWTNRDVSIMFYFLANYKNYKK
ncbi:hypothetical protein [Arcobacter sp. LA11]|uniref:hypothetical protein n=1 Tax=Arcobacter sp. LA11 TaxID=1898176 RepID=UPI00093288C2|nr:hypothetical protein [Arcobacter sp. LA11]